jgi:N-acyl-D-aspartate/D-glutamate deacylase
MLDLLVKNALVFDGLGTPSSIKDLGVRDGRIVAIERYIEEAAHETIDARRLWLLPGFVDIHTHYDIELEIAPGLSESVRHGVTSVIMGNCSLSLTVGKAQTLADIFLRVENLPRVLVQKWLERSISWDSPAAYMAHLREIPMGPNVAALVGHSAVRAEVMGLERSLTAYATDEELERMRLLTARALDAGCIGISIDMLPWHMMSGRFKGRPIPSQHAAFREYRMLAALCRSRDAVLQVTPNPQNAASFLQILWMALSLGADRPLRVTILSALDSVSSRQLWRLFPTTLFIFNRLLGSNIRFQTLTQPFEVFSDGPITPLFEEFSSGVRLNDAESREERQKLWSSNGFRDTFAKEWITGWRKTFHRDLSLMKIVACPEKNWEQKTFSEVAKILGKPAMETLMDLLATFDMDIRWVATGANDRLSHRLKLMANDGVLPGFTDAGAHVRNLGYYDGPLALLKQVFTTHFLPMERAVARVTGEAAQWFGLEAGVIKEGAQADFVLLHPDALSEPIAPQTAIRDPLLDGAMRIVKRGSENLIESVYIAGRLVVSHGEPLPNLGVDKSGRLLTRRQITDRRDRVNSMISEHPFTDYWDVFVLKHQHPGNIAMHMLGVIIFYGFLLIAAVSRDWRWLLALPLSQIVGLIGHFLFERTYIDGKDAIFSVRASRCLNRMFIRVLMGHYKEDLQNVRSRLANFQARLQEKVVV